MIRRFVAPAGTPLEFADLSRGLVGGWLDRQAPRRLEVALAQRARRSSCWLVSSGRAGLTLILRAMKSIARDPRRTQVIVPAYTCYSVAASVARAGLELRLCDIETRTLGLDPQRLEQLDLSRALAVVTTSLYGIPSDLERIEAIATKAGVQLVDDAAQAMGAAIGSRPVGGFGNAGLFSFDKGKNLTTIQGGAILADEGELATALTAEVGRLAPPRAGTTALTALKVVAYAALLRPSLYGAIRRLPFLGLGRTPYETDYPLEQYTMPLSHLAERLHDRLDALNCKRNRTATALRSALSGLPGVKLIDGVSEARSVYARYPVLVDAGRRDALILACEARGIGASASYPRALADVPEIAPHLPTTEADAPVARAVAARIITLPTHPLCPPDMAATLAAVFERAGSA